MFTTTEENEAALSLFCDFGIFSQDQFAYKSKLIYGEKSKVNIFENCTCQQVNKAKNIGDKQRSPWSYPLLTAFSRSDNENFLIHSELTETNNVPS